MPTDEGTHVDEPLDLERARLLLVWLQARRRVDACLSELLAAGPAGERRVRARLDSVEELEQKAASAFASYCASARAERDAAGARADSRRVDARTDGRRGDSRRGESRRAASEPLPPRALRPVRPSGTES